MRMPGPKAMTTKFTTDRFTSRRMSCQKVRNTAPEVELRRNLRNLGLGHRIELPLPGTPRWRCDIAFTGANGTAFVEGCFWHSCTPVRCMRLFRHTIETGG